MRAHGKGSEGSEKRGGANKKRGCEKKGGARSTRAPPLYTPLIKNYDLIFFIIGDRESFKSSSTSIFNVNFDVKEN